MGEFSGEDVVVGFAVEAEGDGEGRAEVVVVVLLAVL